MPVPPTQISCKAVSLREVLFVPPTPRPPPPPPAVSRLASPRLRSQKYRTNLGAPPSPREIETGLGKESGAPTNGGGTSGERSSSSGGAGGGGALADTVQEAEDLEALLMGGAVNGQGTSHVGTMDPA